MTFLLYTSLIKLYETGLNSTYLRNPRHPGASRDPECLMVAVFLDSGLRRNGDNPEIRLKYAPFETGLFIMPQAHKMAVNSARTSLGRSLRSSQIPQRYVSEG